ncbi:MAG: hypothetical protein RKR03_03595 [Candidatus Competibacter sp.]|nr:hypothetical protein [Candidatus Competibacter sp.]
MNIKHPMASENVAKQIASSWLNLGGNFILVAPPLTYPDYVFKLLRDASFQEKCGLDPEKLAIAYLSPASYRTSKEFVKRTLSFWKVNINNQGIDTDEELELLEFALEILEKEERTPVILLPQFHKTIEKLTWTLGAHLRQLEVNFGLSTVVELPIPLSRLRDRWEMTRGKETFICSDFGQGHNMIFLTGYQRDEVKALAESIGLPHEYWEIILSWSGGIPALVRWLISEAKRTKSVFELKISAQNGSLEQCQRFLNWLDAPGSDFFKHRVSALWRNVANEEDRTAVRDHDWKEILIDRNGDIRSATIGFACTNSIGGKYQQSLATIASVVAQRKFSELDGLVNGLSLACRAEERIKLILAIITVWRLATGFSPDWESIEKAAKKAAKEIERVKNKSTDTVITALIGWQNFAKDVKGFARDAEENSGQGWRLTDSLSGRGGGSALAAVQLVLYRLYEAEKISDNNTALKSVLEIPEQILQIYCGRKLQIPVWEAPEFPIEDIEQVRALWKQGEYRKPSRKSRLGFTDLLFIGWIRMAKLEENNRLFEEFSDIEFWREAYEDIRNQPSHSITFESKKRWQKFYSMSLSLAGRLARSLTGKSSDEVLPKLDEIIASIANSSGQSTELKNN